MTKFSMIIEDLQHIKKLEFSIDFLDSGLIVIVGKNGVGKTMLFKGIQNLITSNTFAKTSNKYIYQDTSKITYDINDGELNYSYTYNPQVETLDYKGEVDEKVINNIFVELPIPFGKRFKQFQSISDQDKTIRLAVISKQYNVPTSLISLLNYIYDTNRFDNLIEVDIKNEKYYAVILENNFYIREDYLSSGEYFIINIFKYIQKGNKLIAIDEIDISLDAMAQVRFVEKLRELTKAHDLILLFSTHSLALIKTLKDNEIIYMDLEDGMCSFENKSYNHIKSLLYGFQGYDKYILTEDTMLNDFIHYLLKDENIFSKYLVLHIGGDIQVVSLLDRNHTKEIFDKKENVISVLDGDTSYKNTYKTRDDIYFLPFQSIEKDFFLYFQEGSFGTFTDTELKRYNVQGKLTDKKIYAMFIRNKLKSQKEIFDFLSEKKEDEVELFKEKLIYFLNKT